MLQKYLQALYEIQQRLVKVITEVSNEDSIVSLSIKCNDCIISTILWFNNICQQKERKKSLQNIFRTGKKKDIIDRNVFENVDIVNLEQCLLMDIGLVDKRKKKNEREIFAKDLKIRQKKAMYVCLYLHLHNV